KISSQPVGGKLSGSNSVGTGFAIALVLDLPLHVRAGLVSNRSYPERESFPFRSSNLLPPAREGSFRERTASLLRHRSIMAPGREIDRLTRSRGSSCGELQSFPASGAGLPGLSRDGQRGGGFRSGCGARALAYPVLSSMLLVCGLILVAGVARGQGPNHGASKFYPDSSEKAETLLRNAASLARDSQWSEAIEIYQRIIDQYGDKVAKLPKDKDKDRAVDQSSDEFVLFVDLRAYCHRSLAKLPPDARGIYRNRMDSQAERWFREGASRRDAALLRRVVELAFCSSWGDEALELLGDLAFQDGRFGEALAMYRPLVPDRPDDTFSLVHPDPSVDLARVAAKKLLCRAAAGEKLVLARELEIFSNRFPGAAGALTGRKGPYAKILEEALRADQLAPPPLADLRRRLLTHQGRGRAD